MASTETEDPHNIQLVADLAEDLAVEILSEFKAEDYPHLAHTITKLKRVEEVLGLAHRDVPFPVKEVLRNYRRATN